MASTLYDNINSNNLESNKEYGRLYQPNLTVTRQAYKGVRDSEKINLEINQILFDLTYIQSQIEEIRILQEQINEIVTYGYVATDGSSWPFITSDSDIYSGVSDINLNFELHSLEDTMDILEIFTLIKQISSDRII